MKNISWRTAPENLILATLFSIAALRICAAGVPADPKEAEDPADKNASIGGALNKKLDVDFKRRFLSEVLSDLDRRAGMKSAIPATLDKTYAFTLSEKNITVKQVLEKAL